MKQLLTASLMLCILLCTVSCSKENTSISIGEDIPFTFTTGNGKIMGFSKATISTNLPDDCANIFASTDGTDTSAGELFTLFIQTENCREKKEGENIKIKEFLFSKPLSSNSQDYTTEYSGKIHLIQASPVSGLITVLRFSDIKCTLKGETYTMNGDLHLEVIDGQIN